MADSSISSPINREIDRTSHIVTLPNHNLFLCAAGPIRNPGEPAIIIVSGLGHGSIYWAAVARQLSALVRVNSYDRSGYGFSELSPSPAPRTASILAHELKELLETAEVKPPYIVIAHSYGGIISREFLALEKEGVVGMVFVDANTERSYIVRPKGLQESFGDIMQHIDFNSLINLESRQKLTSEEWAAINDPGSGEDQRKHGEAFSKEWEVYEQSAHELGEKKQFEKQVLGQGLVSVVKGNNEADMRILHEEAVKAGYGSDESRNIVGRWLQMGDEELNLQEEQLRLSKRGRLVHASKSGHDVHITEPEIIAEEVKWILSVLKESN